jgi:SAM dependent carboxyl methyltransferase
MEGRGAYNANSAHQASWGVLALPMFEQAAVETPAEGEERPIVIVDYGSSEGRNSLIPMRIAIRALRARLGTRRAICVVHTDLPANDFSTLFDTVENARESYATADPVDLNVFPSAVGRTFYRAVLPSAYVDLGWSSYAAQWLSRIPTPVPDHIIGFRSTGSLRQAFADQARADWESFLTLRADELRTGGRLVVCFPSLDNMGSHPAALLFDTANSVIAKMLAEGDIAAEERERMCLANYPRTPAETLAPFVDGKSRFGLRLVSSSFVPSEDSSWAIYEQDGDADTLAARRAGFFRATFGPSLASALNLSGDEVARKRFTDQLELGMRRRLASHLVPMANMVAILSLAKI